MKLVKSTDDKHEMSITVEGVEVTEDGVKNVSFKGIENYIKVSKELTIEV